MHFYVTTSMEESCYLQSEDMSLVRRYNYVRLLFNPGGREGGSCFSYVLEEKRKGGTKRDGLASSFPRTPLLLDFYLVNGFCIVWGWLLTNHGVILLSFILMNSHTILIFKLYWHSYLMN